MVLLRNDIEDIRKIVSEQIISTIMSEEFQNRFICSLMDKIDAKINEKFSEIEKDFKLLSLEVAETREENEELKRCLDKQEQHSRNRNLRIFGLKYEKSEVLLDRIIKLFKDKLKVDISPTDVENCHRTAAKSASPDKPPAILIQFRDVNKRAAVLKERKILKNTGIAVKEDLTQCRVRLLKLAVKSFSGKNVWSHYGSIYVRYGEKVHRIERESDLDKLKQF